MFELFLVCWVDGRVVVGVVVGVGVWTGTDIATDSDLELVIDGAACDTGASRV